MGIRKHRAGELAVEQTHDFPLVREMLARAGMITDGIEWPAACYLVAYVGDEAVGVIGVESRIDAALIRSLYVNESIRRRGIGTCSAPKLEASSRGTVSRRSRLRKLSRRFRACLRLTTIASGPGSLRARSPIIWT